MAEKTIDVMYSAIQENKLNLGLLFDKYVLWWYNKKEKRWECNLKLQVSLIRKIHNNPQKVKTLIFDPNIPVDVFRKKLENERLSILSNFFPKRYVSYRDRIDYFLDTLERSGFHVRYLPDKNGGLPLSWRAIINLGATSVYETSLLFHRNYSIPYIPGSAVKGVTRQWVILKVSEVSGKKPKEIDDALNKGRNLGLKVDDVSFSDLIGIFGTESQKGEVTFFDALPVIKPNRELVVLDVMNVHYKPYYEKEEPPGDWHKPVPIFFLAVEKGTEFRFALASKNEGLVIKAVNLLGEALKEIGIGAKTSAGYGFFGVSYGDRV
jgi:CRISPR-associated protein Cmr6